jgi:hypothetical protein
MHVLPGRPFAKVTLSKTSGAKGMPGKAKKAATHA